MQRLASASIRNEDEVSINVIWDDQQKINLFNRLNSRFRQIAIEVKALDEEIEKLSDASEEIFIADDIKFAMGDVFLSVDSNAAESLIESTKARLMKDKERCVTESAKLESRMGKLKAQLYAKFGKTINLEDKP